MICEIMHDPIFLSLKSEPATREDLPIAADLMDTLLANRERCVGMAANMIGKRKNIIAVADGTESFVLLNPVILKTWEPYETEEGCLSLDGVRKTTRYRRVKVQYDTVDFQKRIKTFTGWTAQIIQHEIDHCNGRLI